MNNVVEKKYGIVNASFNVGEISDKILKESKRDNKFRESVSFFKNCPYFITNKCKSINWCLNSPCWKCFKEGEYNIRNAGSFEKVINIVSFEGKKCR